MALSNQIGVLLNVGKGSFTNPVLFATEALSYPSGIWVANLNNDNWMDIIVIHKLAPNIGIFLGSGERTFVAEKYIPLVLILGHDLSPLPISTTIRYWISLLQIVPVII